MPEPHKPILCLDFDGVIHSYTSLWKGPAHIPDPPVDGALQFIIDAQAMFSVVIYSSRSIDTEGLWAMKVWLAEHMRAAHPYVADAALAAIEWANKKPAAFLTIDDRAMLFTGTFPDPASLLSFKPWNRK